MIEPIEAGTVVIVDIRGQIARIIDPVPFTALERQFAPVAPEEDTFMQAAMAKADRILAVIALNEAAIRADEREKCARRIPTNWLDPLLTGDGAKRPPLGERDVEALLRGVQDRIRSEQ